MAITKRENGIDFPAAAYAYVPDPEKPSTWKLRLWEDLRKKVTRRQLGAAAAALSPGGFRGQPVQLPQDAVAKVKARIRAEYRKLGVKDKNMPASVRESAISRTIQRERFALDEAEYDADAGEVTVTVIQPGFNTSKSRYYPREVLERDAHIFEGNKMFADHPTKSEQTELPERSVRSWVGQIKEVFTDATGAIKARAAIVQPWFQSQLAALREQGLLHEMGVSIVAIGEGVQTEIEGVRTTLVERLIKGRSVDFVTYAGAGGYVETYESEDTQYDVELINAEELETLRPDLVESVIDRYKTEVCEMDKLEEKIAELEAAIAEKDSTIKAIEAERDELREKAEAAEREAMKAKVAEKIAEADLPEPTKARLTKEFAEETDMARVELAVEAAIEEIAALKESGQVRSVGVTEPTESELAEKRERILKHQVERYMAMGLNESEARQRAESFINRR